MQVWRRSGHLSARRSDLRKSLQTDNGRRVIALAHSWNELKMEVVMVLAVLKSAKDKQMIYTQRER